MLARVIAGLGLALLAAHFLATAIYLNPISVVGLAWHEPTRAYLEPLFRQRWSLFAPDPPLIDRRLDYQCEVDGQPGPWLSRSDALLGSHGRWRLGPAASLRRLESAAILATVGSYDPILDQLIAAYEDSPDRAEWEREQSEGRRRATTRSRTQSSAEQRRWLEDVVVERIAANIRSSETAYRLVRAYCREDLGREPERMRFRIVTREITPYSQRQSPPDRRARQQLNATTLAWLGADELHLLELRAKDYLEAYAQQKRADLPAPDHDDHD